MQQKEKTKAADDIEHLNQAPARNCPPEKPVFPLNEQSNRASRNTTVLN